MVHLENSKESCLADCSEAAFQALPAAPTHQAHSSHNNSLLFWTVVLEKTLDSPLDFKEIQSVHPKGDQS